MYILPKDIHKDTMDIIPYGFEVDIIKDYSSLQKDIADVFNVIDRESPTYVETIEKVIREIARLMLQFTEIFHFLFLLFHLLTVYTNRNRASKLSWL